MVLAPSVLAQMTQHSITLERIRTDGWFERLGESIGSFHTLCDVLGEHFFAFALITGARVSSLMIDRFTPDQSLVEFSFGAEDDDAGEAERLTVVEFRQRLVATLLTKEPAGPAADALGEDMEAVQQHIGPRTLLLAPLYGYSLQRLCVEDGTATLEFLRHGAPDTTEVIPFRQVLREHVRQDLERGVQRRGGTAIDLKNVDEAELAADADDWHKVLQLLGSWPMPLSIYWRTPEGQMLPEQARQRIAEGLGLLGMACAKVGDNAQGEEVLRLAVQYAQDGSAAPIIFARLGGIFLQGKRPGEAIGPLRRAYALGGRVEEVLPQLMQAFLDRGRPTSALAYYLEAQERGLDDAQLVPFREQLDDQLGTALERWRKLTDQAS